RRARAARPRLRPRRRRRRRRRPRRPPRSRRHALLRRRRAHHRCAQAHLRRLQSSALRRRHPQESPGRPVRPLRRRQRPPRLRHLARRSPAGHLGLRRRRQPHPRPLRRRQPRQAPPPRRAGGLRPDPVEALYFSAAKRHGSGVRSLRSLVVRSLRSLLHVRSAHFGTGTACPFVRSLRSLLLKRWSPTPYKSERSERTKGRRPYKSERSERTTASKAACPALAGSEHHLRPPTPPQREHVPRRWLLLPQGHADQFLGGLHGGVVAQHLADV